MALLAIPNVSEGRDLHRIASMVDAVSSRGPRVLDVHSDADHGRSVLTVTGTHQALVDAMTELSRLAASIDLTKHDGIHPRLGGLDVCPFVAYDEPMTEAIEVALATAAAIGAAGIPVYLYGAATPDDRPLPSLRKGGVAGLIARARDGFVPDTGPREIDPHVGVVCVGARDVLIAFNVWLSCDLDEARRVAAAVRAGTGGLPGVKALAFDNPGKNVRQVSMNLVQPETTGIEPAYEAVVAAAPNGSVIATEIVGLVPERFLPGPDAEVTRLLIEPGHSLESALPS